MQPRKLVIVALAILTSWGAACAKGTDSSGETEDGSGGTGTGTSSDGGGGSKAQASSQASSSTSASAGGAGGTGGGPCMETPCKLVSPQCGCDVGQACSIELPTTANPTGRVCANEGMAKVSEKCTGANSCAAGSLCVTASTQASTCLEFCDTDMMCNAPGGLCVIELNDGKGGTIPNAKLCSDNCDPATSVGCPVPNTSCQLGFDDVGMRFFTMCRGQGAGTQGASCTTNDDCAQTYGCINLNMVPTCLKYCNVSGGSSCPGATLCNPLNPAAQIGATEYGACT